MRVNVFLIFYVPMYTVHGSGRPATWPLSRFAINLNCLHILSFLAYEEYSITILQTYMRHVLYVEEGLLYKFPPGCQT
jgi:hypothetical protein